MDRIRLGQLVNKYPFPDYHEWWAIGSEFSSFMSEAIISHWSELHGNKGDLGIIKRYVSEYVSIVYSREARDSLVEDFVSQIFSHPLPTVVRVAEYTESSCFLFFSLWSQRTTVSVKWFYLH